MRAVDAPSLDLPARPAVVLLVAVWGPGFIRQFLDLGLRTLLAPGNIPALARECDCTFRILTRSGQEAEFSAHPIFKEVRRHCSVEFLAIDDIIFQGNHSTTITLAYARGMRHSGGAMTRTYFVFLVADYIMADGSLGSLWPLIQRGVSGITTGNFQIVKEDAEPALAAMVAGDASPLSITPRALLRLALQHLHPVVLRSMPGRPAHTIVCNRVFWPAGDGTLVGRFYLRHMLCIRPETDQFEIGASCDYSFIPEMCRSGNVVAIDDSDRFCVIEMQPRNHEKRCHAVGRLTPRRLASYLSDWTTADHRRNADTATVFHVDDLPPEIADVIATSAAFVKEVSKHLPSRPQPHRGHPYWHAALGASEEYRARLDRLGERTPFTRPDSGGFAGEGSRVLARQTLARRLYDRCVRNGLFVFPWHPGWHDMREEAPLLQDSLREVAAGLVVAVEASPGTDWLARTAPRDWRFVTTAALEANPAAAAGSFGRCLVFLRSDELFCLPAMLAAVRDSVTRGGDIVVRLIGELDDDPWTTIGPALAGFQVRRFTVVRSLTGPAIGAAWTRILLRASLTMNARRWAMAAVRLAGLSAAQLCANVLRLALPWVGGSPTSVTITLTHD